MDKHIMNEAIELAKKSDMHSKHGCIIVDNKGNIISSGFNKFIYLKKYKYFNQSYDTDPSNKIKISVHAEENALRLADPKKLKGAKLYVIRWGVIPTNPIFLNSKPCHRCQSIIQSCMKKHGLSCVLYSI
jgi:deoxycytidylate deaminase